MGSRRWSLTQSLRSKIRWRDVAIKPDVPRLGLGHERQPSPSGSIVLLWGGLQPRTAHIPLALRRRCGHDGRRAALPCSLLKQQPGSGRIRNPLVVVDQLQAPTLTGSGCSLRRWRLDDAEALEPACRDLEICRFTTVPREYGRDAAERWIQRQHSHLVSGTAIVLAILANPGAPPVGMAGLFGLDRPDRTARFGYWVVAAHRRRGRARGATRLLADWAFSRLGLVTIYIDREPGNVGSARVAESLGAVVTGARSVVLDGERITLVRHELAKAAHDQHSTPASGAP